MDQNPQLEQENLPPQNTTEQQEQAEREPNFNGIAENARLAYEAATIIKGFTGDTEADLGRLMDSIPAGKLESWKGAMRNIRERNVERWLDAVNNDPNIGSIDKATVKVLTPDRANRYMNGVVDYGEKIVKWIPGVGRLAPVVGIGAECSMAIAYGMGGLIKEFRNNKQNEKVPTPISQAQPAVAKAA